MQGRSSRRDSFSQRELIAQVLSRRLEVQTQYKSSQNKPLTNTSINDPVDPELLLAAGSFAYNRELNKRKMSVDKINLKILMQFEILNAYKKALKAKTNSEYSRSERRPDSTNLPNFGSSVIQP